MALSDLEREMLEVLQTVARELHFGEKVEVGKLGAMASRLRQQSGSIKQVIAKADRKKEAP